MATLQAAVPTAAAVRPSSATARRLFVVAVPGLLYLTVRAVGLGLYWLFASTQHGLVNLHPWDGDWYLAIAEHGYAGVSSSMLDAFGHHTAWTAAVFFPGFPLAVKVVATLLGGDFAAAAVVVSLLAGVAAAHGVARLARTLFPSAAAPVAVVLFAAAPMSVAYILTYPEALLVALSVWALVGMVEGRWWLVAPCVVAAGYVSPMAAPLIAVTVVAGFVAAYRSPSLAAPVTAAVTAPLGMAGYLAWISFASGGTESYFAVQRAGWGTKFDFGVSTVKWLGFVLSRDTAAFTVVGVLVVLATVVMAVVLARSGVPWPVWVYTGGVGVLVLMSGGIEWDKPRLLLAAFPVVLPLAAALARRPLGVRVAWVVGLALVGLWFGAYSLTAWHYSI